MDTESDDGVVQKNGLGDSFVIDRWVLVICNDMPDM